MEYMNFNGIQIENLMIDKPLCPETPLHSLLHLALEKPISRKEFFYLHESRARTLNE